MVISGVSTHTIPPSTSRCIKSGWDGSTCAAGGAQGCGNGTWGLEAALHGKMWAPKGKLGCLLTHSLPDYLKGPTWYFYSNTMHSAALTVELQVSPWGGAPSLEKSHFARAMRQGEELQGDLTSPRISEDLLVSECCPPTSANPGGK